MRHSFQISLLRWYQKNKRHLPWRQTHDPYAILVSEIMLQQTQVQTVIPYYHRFLKAFPSFHTLARAPLNRVLKRWEGLGYYSRARNLHALAKWVVKNHHGKLPHTFEEILPLPGIGRYTAGAILSIAFEKPYPVLDGNVQRVFARYFGIADDLRDLRTSNKLWSLAESLIPKKHPGDYNQALMELGATVCTPKNPTCLLCPVRSKCQAYRTGRQQELPVKSKAKPVPHYHIGAGVIWRKNKILISQRPEKGLLGGLWEFAGGKREGRERMEDCVKREIQEELGIRINVGRKIAEVDHAYSHFKITLHAHECRYVSGEPRALGCMAWKWVTPRDLRKFAFPAANQPIIERILSTLPHGQN